MNHPLRIAPILIALTAVTSDARAGDWNPHVVRQLNGQAPQIRLDARLQVVTERWNRVVAVPYLAYMAEQDRLLMLVSCDYPHHPMMLQSDDRGATWSEPRNVGLDASGRVIPGLGVGLTYLGQGNVLFYSNVRWFSRDYGKTWGDPIAIAPVAEGRPWNIWDPPLVDRDGQTGKLIRILETGYTGSTTAHQQGYLRSSRDGGRTWSEAAKIPQWEAVSEVALIRAGNGDLVAACRTDIPARMVGESLDHYEGLGISISQDDGSTWSPVKKLFDWGRHHPSLLRLPDNDLVMTYVVRKGYVATADGFPQFGVEAVVSHDHGKTWDLDHRYILHHWVGHRKGPTDWWPSSQATSTVLLPDGSILTAFGTGYRCKEDARGMSAPRDVGLVHWRPSPGPLNQDRAMRDAPFDSDLRNIFKP